MTGKLLFSLIILFNFLSFSPQAGELPSGVMEWAYGKVYETYAEMKVPYSPQDNTLDVFLAAMDAKEDPMLAIRHHIALTERAQTYLTNLFKKIKRKPSKKELDHFTEILEKTALWKAENTFDYEYAEAIRDNTPTDDMLEQKVSLAYGKFLERQATPEEMKAVIDKFVAGEVDIYGLDSMIFTDSSKEILYFKQHRTSVLKLRNEKRRMEANESIADAIKGFDGIMYGLVTPVSEMGFSSCESIIRVRDDWSVFPNSPTDGNVCVQKGQSGSFEVFNYYTQSEKETWQGTTDVITVLMLRNVRTKDSSPVGYYRYNKQFHKIEFIN